MKLVSVKYVKDRSALLLAIFAATMVGGVTSGLVLAAIPDNNGQIHTCYRNTALQKTFRVIDSSSQTCAANETPLSWDQSKSSGVRAYASVLDDGSIDRSRSLNVTQDIIYKNHAIGRALHCLKIEGGNAVNVFTQNRIGTVLAATTGGGTAQMVADFGFSCPSDTNAAVETTTDGYNATDFYVSFL